MKMTKLKLMAIALLISSNSFAANLATDAIFNPNSFWYTPIPLNAQLHENSAAFVADFLRQKSSYYGNVTINTTSYASPVYYAGPNAPTVKVTQWDCQHKGYSDKNLSQQWAAVP